jgi:RNA polymerase sigma-70 factor, ECF subfamily
VAEDFRRFVAARQRSLLRTAWLLTGNWSSAEDLVQTALMRAWPHWRRIAGGGGADPYVRRIMVNKSTDWRRRRWNGEVPTDPLPETTGSQQPDLELSHVVVQAVGRLPPRQRAVVVLRYFDDLSEADTADALGCSIGTVKSQTAKALSTLRRRPELAGLELERSTA